MILLAGEASISSHLPCCYKNRLSADGREWRGHVSYWPVKGTDDCVHLFIYYFN